jgi:hypothetical protein
VVSGKVTSDMTLVNPRTGTTEKLGHLYKMLGKKNIEVDEIACGDIGAVSKLNVTKTGDTLCDSKLNKALPGIEFDEPCYSMAITSKVKGQEDKIASGLNRLSEIFKDYQGIKLIDYIHTHRVKMSKPLLLEDNPILTIQQVAESVGYTSALTFTRAFKRIEGMTPGSFRRVNDEENDYAQKKKLK